MNTQIRIIAFDPDLDFLDSLIQSAKQRPHIDIKTLAYSKSNAPDFDHILMEDRPDIVILNLDQVDPLKFGSDVLKLRQIPLPLPPLILGLTVQESVDMKREAYNKGLDDCLEKPFGLPEFWLRADALIKIRELQKQLRSATQQLSNINTQLSLSNKRLEELSVTDELTGLSNMRFMTQSLEAQFSILKRHKRPFSIIMIDLDNFKKVNDNNDHLVGSSAIKSAGAVISFHLRQSDLRARYGGDEFIVALPETPMEGAALVAERIRLGLENLELDGRDSKKFKISGSLGVATFDPDKHKTYTDIIKDADRAMYQAKAEGRNRVVRYISELEKNSENYDADQSTILSEIKKITE